MYIGTTSVALNRASAALTLAGITLTTPDIGTPSAGVLTNCTFPTLNQDTTGKSAKTDALNSATTVVNVSSATAPSTGQVLTATANNAATWQTPAGGSVATDAIWDAAGDLVYGTGANTAARLAAGATTTILVGGGAAAPVWTTTTGTGAPVRAGSPTFTTQITTPIIDLTGGQIAFPAVQAASAGVNTLDDYEEGTFTPTISFGDAAVSVAYSVQQGKYTKIGDLVTATIHLEITNNGSSTGIVKILGLPFTNNASVRAMPAYRTIGCTWTSGDIPKATIYASSAFFYLVSDVPNGTQIVWDNTNIPDASYFFFTVSYHI